jgi:ribosomal protein S18 acetylase RimI-like enzyme
MNGDQFMVRLMRRSDIDEVLSIHLSLFEVKYSRPLITSFLSAPHLSLVLVHVADQVETVVGISVATRRWVSLCSKQRTAYLSSFAIQPKYQRRGLGTFLFRLTCRVLLVHFGIQEMTLHMLKSKTPTYEFYRAMGMSASGIIRNDYLIGEEKHDAMFMAMQLAGAAVKPAERPDMQIYPEIDAMLAAQQKVWLLAPWFCHA